MNNKMCKFLAGISHVIPIVPQSESEEFLKDDTTFFEIDVQCFYSQSKMACHFTETPPINA